MIDLNRGRNVRWLLELAIEMAVKRTPVTKYDVARRFGVHHRTGLRYLHTLHEVDLVEPVGVLQAHGNDLSRWVATRSLKKLLGLSASGQLSVDLTSRAQPSHQEDGGSSGSQADDPVSTPS
jgi:hypothetical protein